MSILRHRERDRARALERLFTPLTRALRLAKDRVSAGETNVGGNEDNGKNDGSDDGAYTALVQENEDSFSAVGRGSRFQGIRH